MVRVEGGEGMMTVSEMQRRAKLDHGHAIVALSLTKRNLPS
jgi:hypothetical protein